MPKSSASVSSIIAWSFTASPSTATAKPSLIRVFARVAGLIGLFLLCAPPHFLAKWVTGRSRWPTRFLAAAGWIVGARVQLVGAAPPDHGLIIANHTSWLDILVLGGATGCTFVSKDTLGHGFVHWLADQNATVYVKRAHRKGAKDQALAIAEALERNRPVALFPEGTTGPGTRLLPFRSTLLEAANYAAKDVLIVPAAIDYGAAAATVGWCNEPGKANILRILGRRGTLPVSIFMLDSLNGSRGRKELTERARVAIANRLGFKLSVQSPIASSE